MRSFAICAILLLAVSLVVGGLVVAQDTSETVEGQVLLVQENTLFIRSEAGAPFAFNPTFVKEGNRFIVAMPARTMLPALESGEIVQVTWAMDEREEIRRIRALRVISAQSGATQGRVVTTAPGQLVLRSRDEPGTVTMNPRIVRIREKLVPEPAIAEKLARMQKGMKVTVQWQWDNEGRKRIIGLTPGWQ